MAPLLSISMQGKTLYIYSTYIIQMKYLCQYEIFINLFNEIHMWFIVLLRCLAIQMFLSSCCALLFRCCVIKVMCYPDVVLSYPRVVLCIPGVVDARLERADRCLAEPLLLLTQQEVGPERLWMLPQTPWESGETLKTTAQRALSATPGNKSHHFVYIHNLGSHC